MPSTLLREIEDHSPFRDESAVVAAGNCLLRYYRKHLLHAFPYGDIRKLAPGKELSEIVPDLDLWQSTIAGYCSGGRSFLGWNAAQVDKALDSTQLSFFEAHPRYQPLMSSISEDVTPVLYLELRNYETAREALRFFLERLKQYLLGTG